MFSEYIGALFFIFAAEMGDKTQILAMMFATKYKTSKVLIGIFIGSLLNHGLAILLGRLIGGFIDPNILQVIAGIAFVGFAFWTMLAKHNDEDTQINTSKGAIITVALAFFIGELGDKTQLTAITLAVDSMYPFIVLLGTVSGMLVTSSLGIYVGSKVGDKIPELVIKLVSATVFMIFGVLKLVTSTPKEWVSLYTVIPFVLIISFGLIYVLMTAIKGYKAGALTPLRYAAKQLYDVNYKNSLSIQDLCRTVNHCGTCAGTSCGIGLIRHILEDINDQEFEDNHLELINKIKQEEHKFSREKLVHMLESNLEFLISYKYRNNQFNEVNNIRKATEILLYGGFVEYDKDLATYLEKIAEYDSELHVQLKNYFEV